MPVPAAALLEPLTKQRLRDLADELQLRAPKQAARATLARVLAGERGENLRSTLAKLRVAELRLLCTTHGVGIPPKGGRDALTDALMAVVEVAPVADSAEPAAPQPEPAQVDLAVLDAPTIASVLDALTKLDLVDLATKFESRLAKRPASMEPKARWVAAVARTAELQLAELLDALSLASLERVCRAHGLPDKARSRADLRDRILEAASPSTDVEPATPPASRPSVAQLDRSEPMLDLPAPGDMVRVRQRQYLVVDPPQRDGDIHAVRLVCLDDDAQGEELEVLWELELGARRIDPAAEGLGPLTRLDPARRFAAYYHALAWQCASAADGRLLQAPFHAGIEQTQYQLVPLLKALELPRANLFIADDVGAGKTIEAGLVVQELRLRGRLDWVLIVCPASICLQWQREMQRRFGLRFEIFDRRFVARRRKQRGFGVNPWSTHDHFIISYHLIRRPEYREKLFIELGERKAKSLLILDEAHTAAPASEIRYAVDSQITQLVRGMVQRFENRLFLSATPHNGHTNSFSALLELLDPARFNRGVPVESVEELRPIMIRRLKSDLRALGVPHIPTRRLIELRLEHHDGKWQVQPLQARTAQGSAVGLGPGTDAELRLSELLAEYTKICRPLFATGRGRGRLVFVALQKRLLSSIVAFGKTLAVHAEALAGKIKSYEQSRQQTNQQRGLDLDMDTFGEEQDGDLEAQIVTGSRQLAELDRPARARELLEQMLALADRYRDQPDAKALALLDWIRAHQCPAVQVGGANAKLPAEQRRWSDRRLIIFTEYADTKDWLVRFLKDAVSGTDLESARIMSFEGGMDERERDQVQTAFTGSPTDFPVRILVATDAAREGVNLQTHCQDLIHYDIPWNPARMEQRNGRIDRKLQPASEVRCMYFTHPQRAEDRVLAVLVDKIDRIQRQLGSLSAVVMERLHQVLEDAGIDEATEMALDDAEIEQTQDDRVQATRDELEAQRDIDIMRGELDRAAEALERSSREFVLDPRLLKETVDVACMLVGGDSCRLVRAPEQAEPGSDRQSHAERWLLPTLPASWSRTLDHLRAPKQPDESFADWRARELLPVVFGPDPDAGRTCVQLHLEHPLVQRLFARFRAQGFSMHDLARATVVRTTEGQQVRAIVIGRLSLFGYGATRLHDRLIHIVARWSDDPQLAQHLEPLGVGAQQTALRRLRDALRESAVDTELVSDVVRDKLQASAASNFTRLWPHLRTAAKEEAMQVAQALRERGRTEAEDLVGILERQRKRIQRELGKKAQLAFAFEQDEVPDILRRQVADERRAMENRLHEIDKEIESEPAALRAGYEIVGERLEPVGLIYLWPSTR